MELNYLNYSEQYYRLEWVRGDMDIKLSAYKQKTEFKLDYSELEKKIACVSTAQTYLTELYESHRIESKRNFDLEHLLLLKPGDATSRKPMPKHFYLQCQFLSKDA